MDDAAWDPSVDEGDSSFDVIAMLPSMWHVRNKERTKETVREIQRRLVPHRRSVEDVRADPVAFDALLDDFAWSWAIARSTDSPTLREAAYAALLHALPPCDVDPRMRRHFFRRLIAFDERHVALLDELSAGGARNVGGADDSMRLVREDLGRAGFLADGRLTPLGERFRRFITPS